MYQRESPDANSLSLKTVQFGGVKHFSLEDETTIQSCSMLSRELEVEGLLLKAAASRQGASHEDKRLEEKTWPNILIVGDVGIFYRSLHSKVQVSNNTYLA